MHNHNVDLWTKGGVRKEDCNLTVWSLCIPTSRKSPSSLATLKIYTKQMVNNNMYKISLLDVQKLVVII